MAKNRRTDSTQRRNEINGDADGLGLAPADRGEEGQSERLRSAGQPAPLIPDGVREIGSLADISADPRNANRGTRRGRELLATSLQRFGAGRSVLVDRRGVAIAGNKTLERAGELGLRVRVVQTDGTELVVVQRSHLDLERDPAARELAIADNRTAEVDLEWDSGAIRALLADGIELEPFFLPDELAEVLGDDMFDAVEENEPPAIDKAAELQVRWSTAPGQLWTIPSRSRPGQTHRFLCGDSTRKEDVSRLVGGNRPQWLWSDPPFGISYVGKTADALTIRNDDAAGLPDLLRASFRCADDVLVDGSPIYICQPTGPLSLEFGRAFLETGWHLHQALVWVKDVFVLGHSDYQLGHEGVLYGWRGKNRPWYGGRDKSSVIEIARPK